MLFGTEKEYGMYATTIDGSERIAEREWETLDTYINKMFLNIPVVIMTYPHVRELASLHLVASHMYKQFPNTENVVHFAGLAVHKDHRYKNGSKTHLAKIITQKSIDRIRSEGYDRIVVECTGSGSARIMESLGFKLMRELEYADIDPAVAKFKIYTMELNNDTKTPLIVNPPGLSWDETEQSLHNRTFYNEIRFK